MMLHTINQGFRPCGFRREDFLNAFPIYAYVKLVTPGAGHFLPQGHYLNKLGSGLLDNASYQISRL